MRFVQVGNMDIPFNILYFRDFYYLPSEANCWVKILDKHRNRLLS